MNPATEGSVSLRGSVVGVPADTVCTIRLFSDDDRLRGELATTPVFQRSVVVAPGHRRYYCDVSCEGQPRRFRSRVYDPPGGSKVIDLGSIALDQ